MENIILIENFVSFLCEENINPTEIISVGQEDHDYFVILKSGDSVSFSCERTR